MPLQPGHDPGARGARPECKHGNVFLGLYGEQLHMTCQCSPSAADDRVHAVLRDSRWFNEAPKQGEAHGKKEVGD